MKTLIIFIIMLTSSCSLTKQQDKKRALSSFEQEQEQREQRDQHSEVINEKKRFSELYSQIKNNPNSHQSIYEMLDIIEKPLPSNRMTLKYVKKNESVSCIKVESIGSETSFHCILISNEEHKCVPYQEMCRASFCTGGHKIINLSNGQVIEHFRHFDYGEDTLMYCQSFL